jgi:hypothetical protein
LAGRAFRSIFLFLLFVGSSFADDNPDSTSTFIPNIKPELNIPRLTAENIKIDGDLSEYVWEKAAVASNFTEISPGDNAKPEVETEARVFYDKEYIYFGFTCYENDMKSLRASMSDRDKMYADDWVGPFIDTYGGLKQGFEMYCNPKGIQGDLSWSTNNEDSNFDLIYDSEAKIYKDRWTAEFRIPFKSLRFPETKEQIWRIHLLRNRPRGARQEIYWASVSRDDPSFMGQSGFLKGIKDVERGKDIQFLPYILGTQGSTLADPSDPDSEFENGKLLGQIGINAKYGLSSTLTLDATLNPDFSQVEADAPQISINSPFALFYPEKRPFFLEGKQNFSTPTNVVYTRSINNPLAAIKLSGRTGKTEIGFMSAYDENTPFILPLLERSYFLPSNKKSLSNILRLKYDLGGENYLGAIISDREESPHEDRTFDFTGYNRNIGIDGRFHFASNYYANFQLLGYNTKEFTDTAFYQSTLEGETFDDGKHTLIYDGESFSGLGAYASFSREARGWNFFTEYIFESPNARRDNGFIQNNDYHNGFMIQEYQFYPESKIFRRINPEFYINYQWTASGRLIDEWTKIGLVSEFKNGITLELGYLPFNQGEYGGVFHQNVHRYNFGIFGDNFSKILTGGIYGDWGKYIVRFEDPSFVGHGFNINLYATVKPFDRLRNDIEYSYSQLARSSGGELLYAGYVISDKISYQFNKNFFLRVLLQYDMFGRIFTIDPLLSYKWNPYTIFFVGSSHDINELSNANAISNYYETDRQFFVKFQYLWSL